MSAPADDKVISEDEALHLLEKPDYITDLSLSELVQAHAGTDARIFIDWMQQHADDGIDKSVVLSRVTETYAALNIVLDSDSFAEESYLIESDAPWGYGTEFRISANRVFRLKPAAKLLLVEGLGLALKYAAGPLGPFVWLHLGGSTAVFLGKIKDCYVKLEDDDEKTLFETVYKMQNEMSVIDGVAYEEEDFERAYGKVSPTEQEVLNRLTRDSGLDIERTRSILDSLKKRGVLKEREGRWSVSFW